MYLTKYSKYSLKSKTFLSSKFVVNKSGFFKDISNEPLQKSKTVREANFANKAANRKEEPASGAATSNRKSEFVGCAENKPEGNAEQQEDAEQGNRSPSYVSLVQKKDMTEVLLAADPFDEIPGPVLLKKISNLWKYLPEIGCQATVSAMLSFFNINQKVMTAAKLGNEDARPFERLFRKYGPIVKLQGPLGSDIVLLYKPEHIATVYDQEGKYPIRSTLDSVEKCRSMTRKSCKGPFNMSGGEWEEIRKALQPPLAKGAEKYFDSIEDAGTVFIKRIKAVKNRQNEVPVDFMVEIMKWSMECLCCVTLGKSLGFHSPAANASSEPIRILKALIEATHNICRCESGFQLWRFMNTPSMVSLSESCEIIDAFLSKYIRLAQVNLSRNKDEIISQGKTDISLPFIENLLLNECLAPDEVLTCLVDLLLLGVNTTSSALAFTLYHLAQNQRSQRILFQEVKEILPEKHSQLQYGHLDKLSYLEACLSESFRLRMPMPTLTRVLPNDIALSNFRIPKGTYMVMDAQKPCLSEQIFEKSHKFLPERWLDPGSKQPFSFIPFGHGSRSCLGKQLAEAQLKSCVAKIVRNFQLEYNYEEIQGTKTVFSFPNRPVKLSFIEREED